MLDLDRVKTQYNTTYFNSNPTNLIKRVTLFNSNSLSLCRIHELRQKLPTRTDDITKIPDPT